MLPPAGMICCWPKPPAVPGQQGNCSAALADCPGDREQELADAEEKKTPSAREKAKNAVLEKYTDAQERLDKAAALLGRVEQLAVAGSGLRFTIC